MTTPPTPAAPDSYPGATQSYVPTPLPARNPIGIVALVAGVCAIVASLGFVLMQLPFYADFDLVMIGLIDVISRITLGVLGLAALILGLIGLNRRWASPVAAGIGTGIGASIVLGTAAGLIQYAIMAITYG